MYRYRYPNNLADKTRVLFWTPAQLAVIGVLILAGISSILKTGNKTILLFTLIFTAMTAKFFPETKTGWEMMVDFYLYLTTPQYFQYDGKVHAKSTKKKEKTDTDSLTAGSTDNLQVIKVGVLGTLAVIGMIGFNEYMTRQKEKANTVTDEEVSIVFTDGAEKPVEWGSGNGSVDALTFIKDAEDKVVAKPSSIDTTRLGDTTVTYTVKLEDGSTKDFEHVFTIQDTMNPEISIVADDVTVQKDTEFDPLANVSSVIDPYGGNMTQSETVEKGSYTVTSDVNPAVPGDYSVKITATDLAGNTAEKSYAVHVMDTQ